MRLLFTTLPLVGHLFPMVPLAWAARAAGHEVLVATSESFVPTAQRTGLPTVSWGPPSDFLDLVASDLPLGPGDARRRTQLHGAAFGRIAARSLPRARFVVREWQPDVVVSERAEFAGPIAAAEYEVPNAQFHWGIPALTEFRDAAAGEIDLSEPIPAPIATVNPWPPSMRQAFAAHHLGMRGTLFNGPADVPDWLLRAPRAPRVCVTFGTLVPRLTERTAHTLIQPIVEQLTGLGAEVYLAVADDVLTRWPALAAASTMAGNMPLAQLLPTCDLLVSHGGQGTCMTALTVGCPQLLLPHMDDQFDNAEAVVKAGTGLSLTLDELTPALISSSCDSLLSEPGFRLAAAGVAAELASLPSLADTVDSLLATV